MSSPPPVKKLKQGTLDSWTKKENPTLNSAATAQESSTRRTEGETSPSAALLEDSTSKRKVPAGRKGQAMSQTPIDQREQSSKGTMVVHEDDPTNEEEEVWGQWSEEEVPGAGSNNEVMPRVRRLYLDERPQLSKDEEQHNHRVEQHYTRGPEAPPISLGMRKENLKTSSPYTVVLPQLRTTPDHTVLTTLHTKTEARSSSSAGGDRGRSARSYQRQGSNTRSMHEDPHLWHPDFVKMPFSKKAECTVTVSGRMTSSMEHLPKWEVICESLDKDIFDFYGLKLKLDFRKMHDQASFGTVNLTGLTNDVAALMQANNSTCSGNNHVLNVFITKEAMLCYNQRYTYTWNFDGLQKFLNNHLDNEKRADFFDNVLPKMTKLALDLPRLCSEPIPLLKTGTAHSITMSQEQAACLLANAFFCTFPGCNTQHKRPSFPGINFNRLYRGPISPNTAAKLRCLLHYFKTVTKNMPQGNLTYSRHVLKQDKLPNWAKCDKHFPQLHVSSRGTIEDDGSGMLQVDFANKYIGGGVLGEGCVQEEIRFVICPELIVSLLFTEVLDRNEAVVITGPQRFSNYTGYARSFQWDGDYDDPTPQDNWGRRCTQVVAIDAISVRYDLDQFEAPQVCRELNKAYVGFYDQPTRTAVATGNWGCGAFGGDLRLKALIQLMAAAVAERDVCYFTYKDNTLTQDIYDIHKLITDRNLTVGCVWGLICDYSTYLSACDSRYRSAQSTTRNYGASNSRSVSAYGTKERVHSARDRKKDVFKFIQEKVSSCRITSSSSNSSRRLSDKEEDRSRYGDGKEEDRPNNSPGDEDDGKLWDQT